MVENGSAKNQLDNLQQKIFCFWNQDQYFYHVKHKVQKFPLPIF